MFGVKKKCENAQCVLVSKLYPDFFVVLFHQDLKLPVSEIWIIQLGNACVQVGRSKCSNCDGIWTHSHLVFERTPNCLAKLADFVKWFSVYELIDRGFEFHCSHIAAFWSKEFFEGIQATTERRFTLKRVCDMIKIHS